MIEVLRSECNQYQSIDYSPDRGAKFVCGGKLPVIEVYDEATLKKIVEFKMIEGHTSKIFCVKFDSEDSNLLFSGGWDKNVILWDLRASSRVGAISGPLICGDAIDTNANTFKLLTGSYTKNDSI
jgi:WD40 repeat protein